MNTLRIALPGYNVLTDTNPDHFALLDDDNHVLIKEKSRGSVSVPANTEFYKISHDLGYIPLFLVYVFDPIGYVVGGTPYAQNKWKLLAHNTAGASVPPFMAMADETGIYLFNYTINPVTFKYYIFYDNVVGSLPATITESRNVVKIARSGVNARVSKDPNDYIFHSDLNTFKILKEANVTIHYTTDGLYTFAHGLALANPAAYTIFVKFPDGKTAVLPGKGVVYSFDSSFNISDSYIDTANFGMKIAGPNTPTDLFVKYYIYETPLT